MPEWIWLNGEILSMSEAHLSVEDRGFQFADGVYEVIRFYNGTPFTLDLHLERLWKRAVGIKITPHLTTDSLGNQINNFIAKTGIREGMIYLQLTRGVSPRNHLIPGEITPTLLFYARPLELLGAPGTGEGVSLLRVPDERWKRCWVKSIALLPNVLAKNAAVPAGAHEAAFIDAGFVTECSTSNLFAVI